MSRISFVPVTQWPQSLRDFVQADTATDIELGITRMLAHAPGAAMGPLQFGAALVSNRSLPERLIELMRLRIAFHNQCRSCMAIRYRSAADEVSEDLVCSLERPADNDDLSAREKLAIELGDRFACNHLAIDDAFFAELKAVFSEAQIIELLMHCALYVGMGRLAAVLDMTEELPEGFSRPFGEPVLPTAGTPVVVR
jgi:alkylhydroperoxidase family enzyme